MVFIRITFIMVRIEIWKKKNGRDSTLPLKDKILYFKNLKLAL